MREREGVQERREGEGEREQAREASWRESRQEMREGEGERD